MSALTDLGKELERQRQERHLTQVDFAALLELKQSNYSALIHGTRRPSLSLLMQIADRLQMSQLTLATFVENQQIRKKIMAQIKKLSIRSLKKLEKQIELLLFAEEIEKETTKPKKEL